MNANHVTNIKWPALTDYTVTNAFAHSFLCSRLERVMGFLLCHVFVMHLSPVFVFKDDAIEGRYRYVNMQAGVHTFFSYCCNNYFFYS